MHRMKNVRPTLSITMALVMCSCGKGRSITTSEQSEEPVIQVEHDFLNTEDVRVIPETAEKREETSMSRAAELDEFIEDWMGTPHRMGGNTKKGVDCSGFVIQAYLNVFERSFQGRRAEDIFSETEPVKKKNLRRGDLVFFKISGRRIDHVGIFLENDDFVHVSSSRGVMISNLNEPYFAKHFFMGGRYPSE